MIDAALLFFALVLALFAPVPLRSTEGDKVTRRKRRRVVSTRGGDA